MAAGLGFKTFTTGEVLTAADVNGYLMQGVLVFASAAARNAAITSPQEGQFAFTKDTNGLWYYDGAAWVASGATGDIEGVTAGVGITGGGTSGTVTITNDMATTITAAGDIVVGTGSGTYDNLPIGTTAQVLTADTTVSPYKVKWATPASAASGMTFISRSTFSSVATKDFDNVFTSSYYTYLFVIETLYAGTSGDDLFLQWRYAGPTTQSTNYYGSSIYASYLNTSVANDPTNNNTALRLSRDSSSAASPGNGYFYVNLVGNASEMAALNGQYFTGENGQGSISQGDVAVARTYTGFRLLSGSSNITGAVSIYGLAKA